MKFLKSLYVLSVLIFFIAGCGGGGGSGPTSIVSASIIAEDHRGETVTLQSFGPYGESLGWVTKVLEKDKTESIEIPSHVKFIIVKNQAGESIAFKEIVGNDRTIRLDKASVDIAKSIETHLIIKTDEIQVSKEKCDKIPQDQDPLAKRICLSILDYSGFIKILRDHVSVESEIEGHQISVEMANFSDTEMKRVVSKIPPLYHQYYRIISDLFLVKGDLVTSQKNIKVRVKIPSEMKAKYFPQDIVFLSLGRAYQHQGEEEQDDPLTPQELSGDLNGDQIEVRENASFSEELPLVAAIRIGSFRSDLLRHPVTRELLAAINYYYDPPQEYKDLLHEFLPKILDFYHDRLRFNLDQVDFPIIINIQDRLPGGRLGWTSQNGIIELSYLRLELGKKSHPLDSSLGIENVIPHNFLAVLAHELFHYISNFYTAWDFDGWYDRYPAIEESAATYAMMTIFSGFENSKHEIAGAFHSSYANGSTESIYSTRNCQRMFLEAFRDLGIIKTCNEKMLDRQKKIYLNMDTSRENPDEFLNRDRYSTYTRFFTWAASLNPYFVSDLYDAIDHQTRRETRNGDIFRSVHTTTRELIEQKIIDLLSHPPALSIQQRVDDHYTALFVEPQHPLLEFWANYLLLFHHPNDPAHPTNYYPHFPDVLGGEVLDDVFELDDFDKKDRHLTHIFRHERLKTGFNHLISLDSQAIEVVDSWAHFGEWDPLPPERVSPLDPFSARLLRIYMVPPAPDGEGRLSLKFTKVPTRVYEKVGYMVFKERFDKTLEFISSGSISSITGDLEFNFSCSDSLCPPYFVLFANSNFDYRAYDPSNQGRDLYDIANDAEAQTYLTKRPQFGLSVKSIFTPRQLTTSILTCNEQWFGAYFIESSESIYQRLDLSRIKTWFLNQYAFQLGDIHERNLLTFGYSYDGKIMKMNLPDLSKLSPIALEDEFIRKNNYSYGIDVWFKSQIRSSSTPYSSSWSPRDMLGLLSTVDSETDLGTFHLSGALPFRAEKINSNDPLGVYQIRKIDSCSPPGHLDIEYISFQPGSPSSSHRRIGLEELIQGNLADFFYFDIVPRLTARAELGLVILKDLTENQEYRNESMADERTVTNAGWAVGFPKSAFKKGHRYRISVESMAFTYTVRREEVSSGVYREHSYRSGCTSREFSFDQCRTMGLATPKTIEFEIFD